VTGFSADTTAIVDRMLTTRATAVLASMELMPADEAYRLRQQVEAAGGALHSAVRT